jgi:hypothetical protein
MNIDKELEILREQKETTLIGMLKDKRLSNELKIKKLQDICGFQGGIDLIYDGNDYENCGTCDFALTNGKNCLLSIIAEKLGYVV